MGQERRKVKLCRQYREGGYYLGDQSWDEGFELDIDEDLYAAYQCAKRAADHFDSYLATLWQQTIRKKCQTCWGTGKGWWSPEKLCYACQGSGKPNPVEKRVP